MNFSEELYYAAESYRTYLKCLNCGVSPKTYGMAIQGKRKKKKKRKR